MKKTIRYISPLLVLIACLIGSRALAQSPGANKSRLDIKPKAPAAPRTNLALMPWMKKLGEVPRQASLGRSPSIVSFYRNQLIAQPPAPPVRVAEAAAAPTTPVAEPARMVENTLPGGDKLFSNEKITVSNLYPNPANDYAVVDYAFLAPMGEAKISLYSALGAPVGEYRLDRNERRQRIMTADIPNGVYLYQLSLEGRTVVTKKLLVRHH